VSCDVCMKKGFPGRRYKCLLCDNYDLCGSCYDAEAESQSHKNAHPMQCLLTDTAFELFYAGESIPRRTVVSLTCPHCGLSGFIPRTLLLHCAEKHLSTETKSTQTVMCPICVTSTVHSSRSRFPLLTDHLATVHENGTEGDDDDIIDSFTISKTRATENEEDDSDEDEDDDDNESSFNDLKNRVFAEEEQRLQEDALQRLENASSLAAAIRNEYAASTNRNTSSQRRPFLRQTALRGGRSTLRGHFNHFPYGGLSRTGTGFTSATTNRSSTDTSIGNSSQNATPTDPYAAFVFGQDPMLEFVSRLVNNQPTSSTTTNNQFIFGPPVSIPVPSSTNTSNEFARFQQHMENNESINSLKSSLLNSRHKRSIQAQQQQSQQASSPSSSSTTPSTGLPYPTGFDYQLWQQNFSALQPTINTLNFSTGAVTTGPNSSLSKNLQQLNREHNARSLLGKILRNDRDVNTDDNKNETRTNQLQNHMSFLQSILLSSIATNTNEESNKHKLIVNKENL
ncbi:unnamed protein product, partial [Rotaria socialis]